MNTVDTGATFLRGVMSDHNVWVIMAYGSTPYVGMTPKKNGGHIQSAQMTRSKCPR